MELNLSKSELFRVVPKSFLNQSERRFVSCLMKIDQKSIWLDLIHSVSIWIIPTSGALWLIRIDSSVYMNLSLGLFGFIRINGSDWSRINRIKSDWLLADFYQTRFKPFFEFFRKEISEWLGLVRIESDLNALWNALLGPKKDKFFK